MKRREIMDNILKERVRQIGGEGYTPSYDDQWRNGELAKAAAIYVFPEDDRDMSKWTFEKTAYHPVPFLREQELIKAASLIVAEIERLERAAGREVF